jgi:hypothetical protein
MRIKERHHRPPGQQPYYQDSTVTMHGINNIRTGCTINNIITNCTINYSTIIKVCRRKTAGSYILQD